MKKYEKIIAKMIKDFTEKGLIQCNQSPDRKIIDYLNYMGIVVIRANEQDNPKFTLDDPTKEIITSIVSLQWDLFKETKTGVELIDFYENQSMMQKVVKNTRDLNQFLSTVTSQKMIDEMFIEFVKSGDLESVKKLVEKKSPKVNVNVDACVLAVEHNQPAILDYLFHKDKYQVVNEQGYMGIYARKSIEYNAHEIFLSIIEKGLNIDEAGLLGHCIFYKYKDYAYRLVDMGAKLEKVDSRVDKEFLEDIVSYHNKKMVHDNLKTDLSDKPNKKSAKI